MKAIYALGRKKDVDSAGALAGLLKDPDQWTRGGAAQSLYAMAATKSAKLDERIVAMTGIGLMVSSPRASAEHKATCRALLLDRAKDVNPRIRVAAARALALGIRIRFEFASGSTTWRMPTVSDTSPILNFQTGNHPLRPSAFPGFFSPPKKITGILINLEARIDPGSRLSF